PLREHPERPGRVLLPLRRVEKRPLRRAKTMTASVGVFRSPVSRLFIGGGLRIAVRVLIADAGPVRLRGRFTASSVTRLRGRGDGTWSLRYSSQNLNRPPPPKRKTLEDT